VKDIRNRGEGFFQCEHFSDKEGSSGADFLVQKILDFLKFMVCLLG